MNAENLRRLATGAGPALAALLGLGLVAVSAGFAFGWQRALHDLAGLKLLALLGLVLAARRLRAAAPRPLLGDGPSGPSPSERLGTLMEAALVLAAVSAFLSGAWRLAGSLARAWP